MRRPLLLAITLLIASVVGAKEATIQNTPPTRALDLAYGGVLYEYYQGHAFEALSALNVAKVKGGIQSHGKNPALVEGGLMLSYGMTKEAKKLFESLLSNTNHSKTDSKLTAQISPEDRNQAWFYLAKVFYLEQDYALSLETFKKVNASLLQQEKPELFYELLYLKGQISYLYQGNKKQLLTQINALPAGNIWQSYLRYNHAILMLDAKQVGQATSELTALVNTLDQQLQLLPIKPYPLELTSLKEQCLLSLGQLYLQQSKVQQAFRVLSGIRKDSVFSDQALFSYAVAATNLDKFGLALEALNRLESRPLFTPWLQQVPYALAYLYEKLKQPELALQAYRAAAGHYQQLSEKISRNSKSITEQKILSALGIIQSGEIESKPAKSELGESDSKGLSITRFETDAYGHVKIHPVQFDITALLASEVFQQEISELQALYKLKFSLVRWEDQLDSFDEMLSTRTVLREQKISVTNQTLTLQHADQWMVQQQVLVGNIQTAIKNEDPYFFMDEAQIDFYEQIKGVFSTLSDFPEGEEKQQYLKRIKRIQAYFTWDINDRYAVNRWRVEKQLIGLRDQMVIFSEHHKKLKQEMSANLKNEQLAERIREGRERLITLKTSLELSLSRSRLKLIQGVRLDLEKQKLETQNYLLSTREAQARLSDLLYQKSEAVNADAESIATEKALENNEKDGAQ